MPFGLLAHPRLEGIDRLAKAREVSFTDHTDALVHEDVPLSACALEGCDLDLKLRGHEPNDRAEGLPVMAYLPDTQVVHAQDDGGEAKCCAVEHGVPAVQMQLRQSRLSSRSRSTRSSRARISLGELGCPLVSATTANLLQSVIIADDKDPRFTHQGRCEVILCPYP